MLPRPCCHWSTCLHTTLTSLQKTQSVPQTIMKAETMILMMRVRVMIGSRTCRGGCRITSLSTGSTPKLQITHTDHVKKSIYQLACQSTLCPKFLACQNTSEVHWKYYNHLSLYNFCHLTFWTHVMRDDVYCIHLLLQTALWLSEYIQADLKFKYCPGSNYSKWNTIFNKSVMSCHNLWLQDYSEDIQHRK